MTDENLTGPDAGAAESTEKTPARARTRTRKTTGAAKADAPAKTDAPATAEAPAEAGADAPKAPRASTTRAASSRRRTKAASSEPTAPDAAPAAAPADTAPADEPGAPAEAPKKPATRRRATRPAAAADAPAPDAEAAAPKDEAAPKTTARTSTRRKKAPTSGAAEKAAATDAAPESAAEAEDGSTSARVGGTQRLATTALLFQAPEPTTRPRRRRASAPAGPPRPVDHEAPATEAEAEESVEELEKLAEAPVEERAEATEATETAETAEAAEDVESAEPAEPADGEDETGAPSGARRRRRRGGRGRRGRSGGGGQGEADGSADGESDEGTPSTDDAETPAEGEDASAEAGETSGEGETTDGEGSSSSRRRRRRRRSRGESGGGDDGGEPRARARTDEVTALKGSTRLEAKRQRRREGRDAGRRRTVITEAEFLARRESVDRTMVVREQSGRVQIAILEDGVLVEHYVSRSAQNTQAPMAGNVYLGRVQNVLPSMEAAFVDIGKGRNAVLYAGEVNWDAAGLEGQPRRIEQALKSGDSVLVQVTKEPVGHKGARLTSQITLAGRYLVYVPGGGMTGISRKLPEPERARLKKILREIVPEDAGVIVRTAAEGASDEELRRDVQRLQDQWAAIQKKATTASPPALLQGEPDLAIRVVRDVFNDDFNSLVVQGEDAWTTVWDYVQAMAPDLVSKVSRWTEERDVFAAHRVDEQLAKGMERKVWLPSGGSLVIDRTEAMTVIDVNTGKFTGSGGTLEETVTRNNLEAAEEIVRQLRLRDIGGIIVIDFIDMVLESNRDLVLRRLVECLGRDRTKHQVAEVTSLGLVQMTRKRVGQGLFEAFSEPCPHCGGRGYLVHSEPVTRGGEAPAAPAEPAEPKKSRRKRSASSTQAAPASVPVVPVLPEAREAVKATLATIAAAAAHAHAHDDEGGEADRGDQADTASSAPSAVVELPEVPAAVDAPAPSPDETPDEAPVTVPDPGTTDLLDALASIAATERPAAPAEEPAEEPAPGSAEAPEAD